MKPSLKGDLAALYNAKTTKRRKTADGSEYVEFIYKRDLSEHGYGLTYQVRICGRNGYGVPIAAYSDNGEEAYFFQHASHAAVGEVLANPEKAYDWICVKNGIRK